MYGREKMPWRDEADWTKEDEENEKALKLKEELIEKMVSIHMAVDLGMEEDAVEGLIDNLWNPLREALCNPKTQDLVLTLLMEGMAGDVTYRVMRLKHEIGACGCDG
jgi:hypothetical protein